MGLVPIESAIDPAMDTDAAMAAVLGIIGILFEMTAYGEVYQRTLRWLRRRTGGRWGNGACPPSRSRNIVALIWDGIFLLPGVLACVWVSRVFGVLWCLFPGFLTVMHFYQAFFKRYGAEADRGQAGSEADPDERQLEQLKIHRGAGLLTEREYRKKRRELLKKR